MIDVPLAGRWWLRCAGPCFRDAPTWVQRDPLKLPALAQGAGCQVARAAEGLTVWCPRCRYRGLVR
jgi:hypothetical protein